MTYSHMAKTTKQKNKLNFCWVNQRFFSFWIKQSSTWLTSARLHFWTPLLVFIFFSVQMLWASACLCWCRVSSLIAICFEVMIKGLSACVLLLWLMNLSFNLFILSWSKIKYSKKIWFKSQIHKRNNKSCQI